MKALGLNPGEQEMIDMTNEVNNNGLIFYPDFCKLVLRKYREESKDREQQYLIEYNDDYIFFPNQTLVQVIQRQLCILLADYKSFTTNLHTPPLDYTIQMGILATVISLHLICISFWIIVGFQKVLFTYNIKIHFINK